MWKSLIGAVLGIGVASSANAALVATLTESETGGVLFNLSGDGEYDDSLNLTHLGFIFFDNLGDPFQTNPLFAGGIQPLTIAPFGQVGTDVLIQSIAFDDDAEQDGPDDFVLRFFQPGLSNGDPIDGPFDIETVDVVSNVQGNPFGLTFAMLNPGVYTSDSAAAQAFGGFELRIEATAVPLPAAGWLLLGGIGVLAALRRRKRAA